MIQSVVPTLAAQPATLRGAVLLSAMNDAEAPDFAAFLAQAPSSIASGADPAALLPAQIAQPAQVIPGPIPAAQSGNPLPPAVPDVAASASLVTSLPLVALTTAEAPSETAAKVPAPLEVPVGPAPRSHLRRTATKAQDAPRIPSAPLELAIAAPGSDQSDLPALPVAQLAQDAAAAQLPTLAVPGMLQQPVPALVAQSAKAHGVLPEPVPTDHPRQLPATAAAPEPALQAIAHAAPQAAFLRAATPPAVAPELTGAPPEAAPQPVQQTLRAPASLRVEIALPGAIEAPTKPLEKLLPAARRLLSAEPATPAAMPASAALLQPQASIQALAPASASAAPHDFAALVDRLVAAREAVQPQGATLTVAHAEFGPIELRFRHDTHGIAVALTSADPDFARAAAAAPPVSLPGITAGLNASEPGSSASLRDTASAGGGTASNQGRGQQSERRSDTAPQLNHSPRGNRLREDARRSGIFA